MAFGACSGGQQRPGSREHVLFDKNQGTGVYVVGSVGHICVRSEAKSSPSRGRLGQNKPSDTPDTCVCRKEPHSKTPGPLMFS